MQRLVQVLLVVELEILLQPLIELFAGLWSLQVKVLVLDASPKPFYEDVIYGSALTIHADLNIVLLQNIGKGIAGELAALVGVEDSWCSRLQSLLENLLHFHLSLQYLL